MKLFKKLFVAIALCALFATPAMAQFRFGVKAGVAINDLKFNKDVFESSNQTGFTGGVVTEFTVPVIGIGVDASLLYARRSADVPVGGNHNITESENRDYIDIPINLKWKIGIPAVSKIVSPFITTGPDFSFLVSKKNINEAWKNKTFDTAWTVGAGVELLSKVQVGATYGFGLSKSASGDNAQYSAKNRCWTITAALFF